MKKFEIYEHLDNEGRKTELQGNGKDYEYHLDDILANTYDEAKVIAYEKYGKCVIRWCRKSGWEGPMDFYVDENEYTKAKERIMKKRKGE